MKNFALFPTLALFVFAAVAASAEEIKIGVFDIQAIMTESKTVEAYRKKLNDKVDQKKKIFNDRQESARLIDEKLKREGQSMAPAARKAAEDKLSGEIRELKRMKEDIDIEIQKTDRELTQQMLREIDEAIRKIASAENYGLIFERSAAGLRHVKADLDITKKIIASLDNR